jgi:hypothetical protein
MGKHKQQPWWELPPKSPGEPEYRSEREWLRAELARAWRAVLDGADEHHGRTAPAST